MQFLSTGAAVGVFLILVMFFYLYFVLRDFGIGPDLGGYFGLAVTLAVPLVALQLLGGTRFRSKTNPLDLLFFGMLLICGYILLFSTVTPPNQDPRYSYFVVLVAWIVLYLHVAFAPRDSQVFAFVIKATFVLNSLIIVYYSRDGFLFSLGSSSLSGREGTDATYQFFALIYLLNILLVSLYSTPRWLEFTFLISSVLLLLIGSRTDFVVLLVMYAVYRAGNGLKLSTFLSLAFASALLVWVVSLVTASQFNRLALFLNYGGGNNSSVRLSIFNRAYDIVAKHPVLGDMGNYEPGLYAHQIISIWVDFGLLGFTAYLVCLAGFGVHAWRNRAVVNGVGGRSGFIGLAILLATFCALLVTKSGTYYLVPVVFGIIRWHDRVRRTPGVLPNPAALGKV